MTIETFELTGTKPVIVKDPDAVLDYTVDLTDWFDSIDPPTDYITACQAVGTDVVVDSVSFTNTTMTAWVSGGTVGTLAYVTFHFTTFEEREDDRTLYFKIRSR